MRILIITCLAFLFTSQSMAQNTVEGKVIDATTGDPLAYANVQIKNTQIATSSDSLGRFKLTYPNDADSLYITFIGFQSKSISIQELSNNKEILLVQNTTTLQEIEIKGQRSSALEQFQNIRTGKKVIRKDLLMRLPALAGEPDFIKALTLLPGATKGIEGSGDFFIRGGDADQNLVMLDGATVYSSGHLFGFLSVFNPSAIGEVNMMTGGFPAEYGGRLSSIIDVRSKELNKKDWYAEGGIGLISSRISVEAPIIKDKLAIQIAGRRTYADQVAKLAEVELPYYFYDLNFNVDYQISPKSRLHYGFYKGDDVLEFTNVRDPNTTGDEAGTSFTLGNMINTLGYSYTNNKFSSSTNFHHTVFNYKINSFFQDNFIDVIADIQDVGFLQKFSLNTSRNNKFHFGISSTLRDVDPNLINSGGEISELLPASEAADRSVLESAIFGEWEFKRNDFEGIIGLRYSAAFLEQINYYRPEPRIALKYSLKNNYQIKASYTRMSQYIHRVSSSSFALPTDVWYPVDERVKPQSADQISLGISKLFENINLVASMEGYFKNMDNLVEFREGTNLVLNNEFEEAIIQGDGISYGFEWLARKDIGRLTGWLSYTLSWTYRQFDQLNNGKRFNARYDRRHNIALVANYEINNRWSVSSVWEFISGARFTPIIGYYAIPNASTTGIELIPVFPDRNSVKLADTHRWDLSITRKGNRRPGKRWYGEWQLSIYNVYNRATPIAIDIQYDESTNSYRYEQPGLLGLLPSISYNFKFF